MWTFSLVSIIFKCRSMYFNSEIIISASRSKQRHNQLWRSASAGYLGESTCDPAIKDATPDDLDLAAGVGAATQDGADVGRSRSWSPPEGATEQRMKAHCSSGNNTLALFNTERWLADDLPCSVCVLGVIS